MYFDYNNDNDFFFFMLIFSFRWRDVKMRAFDNAKHRTYVDLKVRNQFCFPAYNCLLILSGLLLLKPTPVISSVSFFGT